MTKLVNACALALVTAALAVGCRNNPAPAGPAQPAVPPAVVTAAPNSRVPVVVDAAGYHPATINAQPGQPLTLVFTRTSDEGCGQQVVFPSLNIQRDLPLNQPVEVTVTPTSGRLAFTCGMNMYRGSVVAQ
jgi:plastocyanin domain-containing protein